MGRLRRSRELSVHVQRRSSTILKWSERRDLNSRPLVPQTSALTGLRYAPTPLEGPGDLRSFGGPRNPSHLQVRRDTEPGVGVCFFS